MNEPDISIGIVSAQEIHFTLNDSYSAKGEILKGEQIVYFEEGGIRWRDEIYRELIFVPQTHSASFSLFNVTIGVNFHWERQETQVFEGILKLIVEETKITAINILPAEKYLVSVISSEMRATAPLEFLKAHAIVSRSWLFAQKEKSTTKKESFFQFSNTTNEHIRWYDREEHTNFDFCADDHCQRFQGITKAISPNVNEAVKATRGQLLMYGKEICDARFSKCCGGITEEYESCWENSHYPYLSAVNDAPDNGSFPLPDFSNEKEAEKWIRSTPDSFCNTEDTSVLSQILNNYDQETTEFYRWEINYSQEELSTLIHKKSNTDYGFIIDLIPILRGKSGRIVKLKIVGSLQTLIIGKELEIRRILSPTHLYSSAFVVEKGELCDGFPSSFTLHGAGWGHGVGLCQIGAAVMGEKGYSHEEILHHYYQGADIRKFY